MNIIESEGGDGGGWLFFLGGGRGVAGSQTTLVSFGFQKFKFIIFLFEFQVNPVFFAHALLC